MKGNHGLVLSSDHESIKPRRSKYREVSSRFLSPSHPLHCDSGATSSPIHASSPDRSKPTAAGTGGRKQRSLEGSGFIRGLWPSSSSARSSNSKNLDTLADHLGNDRLNDFLERKKEEKFVKDNGNSVFSLSRGKSSSEFNRFENTDKEKECAKENHRPTLGGSMRYTGKLRFPGKSSSSSSSSSPSSSNSSFQTAGFVPGRLSVDENALYRNSISSGASRRVSDSFLDTPGSESESSEIQSGTDCSSPAMGKGSRKSGIEVPSKYMIDMPTRPRRGTSDSNIQHPVSLDSSPKMKKFTIKNAIKRANSLAGHGSATSQWALSPGRTGSPPISVESKERVVSFSSLKPPTSPSRPKGVEKLLNLGLDLFKSKKSSSSSLSFSGSGNGETIHELRLLHSRLMQWRYANARADTVNGNTNNQVENNLLCGLSTLAKLQHSVLQKRLQLQKEKLEMKLARVLHSQIKPLEAWGDVERLHLTAVSKTKDCLHSVVCRVPLTERAKADPQLVSIRLRNAFDLSASIKSTLTLFSPSAEKTVELLSQLAEVVTQEKLLLEQCLELLQEISIVEMQERSLQSYMIQLNCWQHQEQEEMQLHQQQQQQQEVYLEMK